MKRFSKSGQVWVETVIYTLIGLTIIGLVLTVAKPKIDAKKDEILIDQAIESLGNINNKIYSSANAPGSKRLVDLKIGKGKLIIDMNAETISWILESSFEYSESGSTIPLGSMNVTTSGSSPYEVELKMGYPFDLRYSGQNSGTKELNEASVPYRLFFENDNSDPITNKIIISITEA
jgi:hypothetical protein|tara:strand:+ start:78 stop:608 length:531 start_codon:yes stop_codon:yes gene_type:complete